MNFLYTISQPITINFLIDNIIGTEELAHLEMIGTIVHQLTDGASLEEIEKAGLGAYYTDHGVGLEYLLILLLIFNCFNYYFQIIL